MNDDSGREARARAILMHHHVVAKHIDAVHAHRQALAKRLQIAKAVRYAKARHLGLMKAGEYLKRGRGDKASMAAVARTLGHGKTAAAAAAAGHATVMHAIKASVARKAVQRHHRTVKLVKLKAGG